MKIIKKQQIVQRQQIRDNQKGDEKQKKQVSDALDVQMLESKCMYKSESKDYGGKNLKQNVIEKPFKFVADPKDQCNANYLIKGEQAIKINKKGWHTFFGKTSYPQTGVHQYTIHILATKNCRIMYGIGTKNIKGKYEAYLNKQFMGYYGFNGTILVNGKPKKAQEVKIIAGDAITVEVDMNSWAIAWYKLSKQIGKMQIAEDFKGKSIYPVILIEEIDDHIVIN